MKPLQDQIVVITGASSGIGLATARHLATLGAIIVAIGRKVPPLDAGCLADFVSADLTDPVQTRQATDAICDKYQAIHVLVHSAGVFARNPFADSIPQDLDLCYQVNVRAPAVITHALLPRILNARGQILFVNSTQGITAKVLCPAYSMSKYALRGLAESLRQELAPVGVRVTSIFPGKTDTPMQEAAYKLEGIPYDPARCMPPHDIALAIAGLLLLPRSAEIAEVTVRPSNSNFPAATASRPG